MIQIVGTQLSQWDTGRIVSVSNSDATKIHFANQGDSKAPIIDIINGEAKIPDYLLQTGKTLFAYAVLDGVTLESKSFSVSKRAKPEDYVYEEDQRNYIYELIQSAKVATEAATQAAQNATTATENANEAAENANDNAATALFCASRADKATNNANTAANNANEAAAQATQTAKSLMVVGKTQGANIALDDAIEMPLVGLRVFGKTTQNGTPTPDSPVDLVSVGDSGSITANVNNAQSMSVATPNGLPGIPVTSGGNYTDANGQQWICDEIDFARGVYIKRIEKKVFDGTEDGWRQSNDQRLFLITWNGVNGKWGNNEAIASHFICNANKAFDAESGYFAIDKTGLCYFAYDKATLAEFKDWLDVNNVTALCPLAATIETPLTEEELAAYAALHTYKDHTTVFNDAGAYMELEYVMDAKKYIDSLFAGGIVPATVE